MRFLPSLQQEGHRLQTQPGGAAASLPLCRHISWAWGRHGTGTWPLKRAELSCVLCLRGVAVGQEAVWQRGGGVTGQLELPPPLWMISTGTACAQALRSLPAHCGSVESVRAQQPPGGSVHTHKTDRRPPSHTRDLLVALRGSIEDGAGVSPFLPKFWPAPQVHSGEESLGTPSGSGGTYTAFSRTDGTSSPETQPRREGASASARHGGRG